VVRWNVFLLLSTAVSSASSTCGTAPIKAAIITAFHI
jgi:hypothetical protein